MKSNFIDAHFPSVSCYQGQKISAKRKHWLISATKISFVSMTTIDLHLRRVHFFHSRIKVSPSMKLNSRQMNSWSFVKTLLTISKYIMRTSRRWHLIALCQQKRAASSSTWSSSSPVLSWPFCPTGPSGRIVPMKWRGFFSSLLSRSTVPSRLIPRPPPSLNFVSSAY